MGIVKKIYRRICERSYETKNKYLREEGAQIGEGTRLNCNIGAFGTEPFLIKVGKDCLFANDVKLITHDGGIKVLNTMGYFNGARMDNMAPINIGDNVYIGTGAYIMPGVHIGDNCVIGARAVVTHDIPSNSVAVGIPAKVIKNIDEYYESTMSKKVYPTVGMSAKEKRKYFENMLLL